MNAQRGFLGILVALVCGCAPFRTIDAGPAAGAVLRVTIPRAPDAITAGEAAEIVVAVARDGTDAFDGDVEVSLASEPGISARAIVIPPLRTTGSLVLSADAARKHGVVALRIAARGGGVAGEVARDILVRGAPGSLDSSFASGGVFTLGESDAEATGALAVAEGKTLLGGRIGSQAAIVRLLADGTLDPAFGVAGVARLGIAGVVKTHDVVEAGDMIALGGVAGSPGRTFVAQVDRQGAPIAPFGDGGILVLPDQAESRSLVPGPEGELVVGGRPTGGSGVHVARFFADGVPTAAWANGGIFLVSDPAPCPVDDECLVGAIAPKAGGKLTLCESRGDAVAFHELSAEGTADPDHELTTSPEVLTRCTSIANNTSLDFWAAGSSATSDFAVEHFNVSPTGGPLRRDPYWTTAVPSGVKLGVATRVAIGGPGLIVAATTAHPDGGPSELALVRLRAHGPLDPTFGGGKSWTSIAIGGRSTSANAVAVGGDGRVVVAGGNGDLVAVRYWQ